MMAKLVRQTVFWANFDISLSKNDGGKLNTVPKPKKCKLTGAKLKIKYVGGSVPQSSKVEQVENK